MRRYLFLGLVGMAAVVLLYSAAGGPTSPAPASDVDRELISGSWGRVVRTSGGEGFAACQTVRLYLVYRDEKLVNGLRLIHLLGETESGADGVLQPVTFGPISPDAIYVVADYDDDGVYTEELDAVKPIP